MSDSIEREAEERSTAQVLSTPARGHKLRRGLLIANVALLLMSSLSASQIERHFGVGGDGTVRIAMAGIAMMCYFAPLMLATVLAAWGPWRPWIRGTLYLLVVAASLAMNQAFKLNLPRIQHAPGLILAESLSDLSEWMVVMVPAIFTMVLLGSWLRVRIGPPELPPVRLSILSVMIATALILIIMSGTIAADEFRNGELFSEGNSDARLERKRLQVLMQAAIAGPIIGLLLALMAAFAFRWWARLLLIALLGIYGGLVFYSASQSAPQFPTSTTNVLLLVYGGMLVGTVTLLLWISICIRLLARSGWPCCRRDVQPRAMP